MFGGLKVILPFAGFKLAMAKQETKWCGVYK